MNVMEVKAGNVIIGGDMPIVVQTMCNTHTSDVQASVEQCVMLAEAGAELILPLLLTCTSHQTLQLLALLL